MSIDMQARSFFLLIVLVAFWIAVAIEVSTGFRESDGSPNVYIGETAVARLTNSDNANGG